MPENSLEKLVAEHPFLQGLRSDHLQELTTCAMQVDFDEGERIFQAGDSANRFYCIIKGKVALRSFPEGNDGCLIEMIGAGDVLGWSWLFAPYVWTFDAWATEPTQALFFYGTRLRERCEEDSAFGYEVMKRVARVVIQRLQAARAQLNHLAKP